MPTVPRYDQPQVQQAALPGARVTSDVSAEAFGGGQSLDRTIGAAQGAATEAQKYFLEEKRKADEVAHTAAVAKLTEAQTRIQIATSKMQGLDAAGAPDYMQQEFQKARDDIMSGLSNREQKEAFEKSALMAHSELDKHVQMHVAAESEKHDDDETQGLVQVSRNAATLNAGDDDQVKSELAKQEEKLLEWGRRKGMVSNNGELTDAMEAKLTAELSKTHEAVIGARLDSSQAAQAKAYFEANKEDMTAEDQLAAQKKIEEYDKVARGNQAWNQVRGMKLSDGQPDEEKMRSAIFSRKDLNDKQKEETWTEVKARSAEAISNKARVDAANNNQFMNELIAARKQGQPMDEARKLLDKYDGGDDYKRSILDVAIQKTYAPPSESDPGTYMDLWRRVEDDAHISDRDINQAFQKGMINQSDWRALSEKYYKGVSEGRSPEERLAWKNVDILADQNFGSNKGDKDAFKYILRKQALDKGMSADEIVKTARDKLEKDPVTQHNWFGLKFGGDKQYVTDFNRSNAESIAWGKAHEDLGGKDVVDAIGEGVRYSGKPDFTPGDIEAVALRYGGYDKIKPGTPVHNAILSLKNQGQVVTPKNIDAVLKRYPNGRWSK